MTGGAERLDDLKKRLRQSVEETLDPGEIVELSLSGIRNLHALVYTDRRVLLLKTQPLGRRVQVNSYRYADIASVQVTSKGRAGGTSASLELTVAGVPTMAQPSFADTTKFAEWAASPNVFLAAHGKAGEAGVRQAQSTLENKLRDRAAIAVDGGAEDAKVCPDCAESVKAAANICRFCGYRFDQSGAGAE
jgi:hypothetical protein